MVNLIVNALKANIAQITGLFDYEASQSLQYLAVGNTITIGDLNGEYAISGAIDNEVFNAGAINQLYNFTDGVVETNIYFGDEPIIGSCIVHKVNVGKAVKRDFALGTIVDTAIGNIIIVYWDTTENTEKNYNQIGNDLQTQYLQRFGILAKLEADKLEDIGGCHILDKLISTSIISIKSDDTTLIKFDRVIDRFYSGKNYCVDLGFSYLEYMNLNDIIKARLISFNFENLDLTQK